MIKKYAPQPSTSEIHFGSQLLSIERTMVRNSRIRTHENILEFELSIVEYI
jgi:hypothetical protein